MIYKTYLDWIPSEMMHHILITLFAAIVFSVSYPVNTVLSQQFNWRTITSQNTVKELVNHDDAVWGVTAGGVFRFDTGSNTFMSFTNTDGLSSILTSTVTTDEEGALWIGMEDGTLNKIESIDEDIRHITIDPDPLVVNDLVYHDSALYLALEFGISLFLIDKEEVNSTFRNLGVFPINSAVRALHVFDGTLWAATEYGAASIGLDSPNPQDPQFWTNYSAVNGLLGEVFCFASDGNSIFAGTSRGVYRLVNGQFTLEGFQNAEIRCLEFSNGDLYATNYSGVFRRISSGQWVMIGPGLNGVTSVTHDGQGLLWAGHTSEGLYFYDTGSAQWVNVPTNTPAANLFEETVKDSEGRLWVASGISGNGGLYMFDGTTWHSFKQSDGLSMNSITGIEEGPDERIWAGTPGAGVMIIEYSEGTISITPRNAETGHLAGSDTPLFCIVQKIRQDQEGNIWLLNKFANNGRAVVAITPQNEWIYFSLTDGLITTDVTQIAFDDSNDVWIGTAGHGVIEFDHNNTLSDKSDDEWITYTQLDGLQSNRIGGVSNQVNSGIWIATQQGINYKFEGLAIQPRNGALSDFITAVMVDPAQNKWFGTPNGISILKNDDITWEHYTTENSDLPNNNIINIYFDDSEGDAYVSTQGGLSVISTPFKSFSGSGSDISVYPNPYLPGQAGTTLVVENVPLGSTVIVYTLTGRLVRNLEKSGNVSGTQAFWDGRDENGDLVPSGIYLVSAKNAAGSGGTAKIAVIR